MMPVDPPLEESPSPVFLEEHMQLLRERLQMAQDGLNPTLEYDAVMARLRSKSNEAALNLP